MATEITQRQVGQLAHLIDDLLDVSRITTNRIQLRKEPVDAGVLVSRAVGTARPAIEQRHHRLVVDVASQEMPLFADPTRIEQVIVNLLANAAKYTPEGGDISVKAYPEDEHAVIKVKDSGVGIPREMLTRVFELFTQVEPTLDRAQGGLGIGLTIVRHLTEMHGGTVSATSEGLGKGSEFSVRLPLSQIRAAATVRRQPLLLSGQVYEFWSSRTTSIPHEPCPCFFNSSAARRKKSTKDRPSLTPQNPSNPTPFCSTLAFRASTGTRLPALSVRRRSFPMSGSLPLLVTANNKIANAR